MLLSISAIYIYLCHPCTSDPCGYRGSIPAYDNIKNILDFGALGDGKMVNDLALQNAITRLNGQKGVLFFPADTYIFHVPDVLQNGLVLRGEVATLSSCN